MGRQGNSWWRALLPARSGHHVKQATGCQIRLRTRPPLPTYCCQGVGRQGDDVVCEAFHNKVFFFFQGSPELSRGFHGEVQQRNVRSGALGSMGRGSRAPRPASGCSGLLVSVSRGPIAMCWTWCRGMAWLRVSPAVRYTPLAPQKVFR